MASSTIPPSEWPALLYAPPPTAAKPEVGALSQMQLDDLHYPRQMLLCQGAGYGIGQCMRTVQVSSLFIIQFVTLPQRPADTLLGRYNGGLALLIIWALCRRVSHAADVNMSWSGTRSSQRAIADTSEPLSDVPTFCPTRRHYTPERSRKLQSAWLM